LGQEIRLTVRTDRPWMLSCMYDRTRFAPRGLFGGLDGARGEVVVSDGRRPHSKERLMLEPGAEVTLRLPGGGGYGHPFRREPERVLADVIDGYVSVGTAREAYGVVIDPVTLRLDSEATEKLRAAAKADARP